MAAEDLRGWLKEVKKMGELKVLRGADWDLEIGCLAELNTGSRSPALLFDGIKGYPSGYRVLCSSIRTDSRIALVLNLPVGLSGKELVNTLTEKLPQWEAQASKFAPQEVDSGPVLENVLSGKDIDLFQFPTPRWHEIDGGRYIGTGDAVITQDPDTGQVNLGTYRVMIQDKKTTSLYISPGKDGRIHYEKYHARGQRCPVAVSVGHHPIFLSVGTQPLPCPEYNFAGAVRNKPLKVIKEEVTGLPIPADAEIVIAGWCPPGVTRMEGPFGEWTGHYASKDRPAPIIEVERLYYRNEPVLLGSPPSRQPDETTRHHSLCDSARIHNELTKNGVHDVRGVWVSEATGAPFIVVSIKQRYPGHAKRAALLASQGSVGAYFGRYVIVVDEDIDPMNMNDVLFALAFRSEPEKDIDIIRRAWSSPLDPMIRKPTNAFFNSRAIIDACKPYDWIDEFPKEVKSSPELVARVRAKWNLDRE